MHCLIPCTDNAWLSNFHFALFIEFLRIPSSSWRLFTASGNQGTGLIAIKVFLSTNPRLLTSGSTLKVVTMRRIVANYLSQEACYVSSRHYCI